MSSVPAFGRPRVGAVVLAVCISAACAAGGVANGATHRSAGSTVKIVATVELRKPTGDRAGKIVIRRATPTDQLYGATDLVLAAPGVGWIKRLDLRPGSCADEPPGSVYHGWDGVPLDLPWGKLAHSAWVVEAFDGWRARVPVACAEHRGSRPLLLPAGVSPPREFGPRKVGRALVVTLMSDEGKFGTAKLYPSRGGVTVEIVTEAFNIGADIDAPHAHIRSGTCTHRVPGREIVLGNLTDDETDGAFARGTSHIPRTLDELRKVPTVLEVHDDLWGETIAACGIVSR